MARKYTALVQPINLEFLTNQMNALQKAYDELQEAISALALEASAVGSMIGPADGKVWDDYQRYMLGILDETDRFNATGLNPTSRLAIFNLRNQYATEVLPIKSAITRRLLAIDDFNKSPEGKSPLYIGMKPSDTSIDAWMNGATPDIHGVDGATLSSWIADEVSKASDRHTREYQEKGYWVKKIGTDLVETAALVKALRTGQRFDNSTVLGLYLNDVLDDLDNSVLKTASNIFGRDYLNKVDQSVFDNIALDGIYRGMKGSVSRTVDQYAMEAVKHNYATIEENQKFNHLVELAGIKDDNGGKGNGTNGGGSTGVGLAGIGSDDVFIGNNKGNSIDKLLSIHANDVYGPRTITTGGTQKYNEIVIDTFGRETLVLRENKVSDNSYTYNFGNVLDVKRTQMLLKDKLKDAKAELNAFDDKRVKERSNMVPQSLIDELNRLRKALQELINLAEEELNLFNSDYRLRDILGSVTDEDWKNYKDIVKDYNKLTGSKLDINNLTILLLADAADSVDYYTYNYSSPTIDDSTAPLQFNILANLLFTNSVSYKGAEDVTIMEDGRASKRKSSRDTFAYRIGEKGKNVTSIKFDPIELIKGNVVVTVASKELSKTQNYLYSIPYGMLGTEVAAAIDDFMSRANIDTKRNKGVIRKSDVELITPYLPTLTAGLRKLLEDALAHGATQTNSKNR